MIRNLLVAAGALLVCVTLVPTRADAEVRFGPSADVAAVAALATKGMSGSYTVGPVVVVGSAAFAEVYSEASAEFFAKKINGKWKIVETNGGAGTAAIYAKFTHGALTAAQICALGHHMPQGPITDCH
jgi:hypothetical protein